MDWAEKTFELDKPLKDGRTKRQHLESVYDQTGRMPPDLIEPEDAPDILLYVLGWFSELSLTRKKIVLGDRMIFDHLTHSEILAWSKLSGSRPSFFEVSLILRLDRIFVSVMNKE